MPLDHSDQTAPSVAPIGQPMAAGRLRRAPGAGRCLRALLDRPGHPSRLEDHFALQVFASGLPMPEREVCLIAGRRFRCDFVWRDEHVVVEVEGGLYHGGRHTAVEGFIRDAEKYNLLALDGWLVLRVTERHLRTGEAVAWLRRALERRP